jgi:hypothetical protein
MRRITILPVACYAAILGYACYAWFHIGHWPYYAHPDPKELPNHLLLQIASMVFLIGALSVVLIPLGYLSWRAVAIWRKVSVSPHSSCVVLYLVGLALWALDLTADFTDVPWKSTISWILD